MSETIFFDRDGKAAKWWPIAPASFSRANFLNPRSSWLLGAFLFLSPEFAVFTGNPIWQSVFIIIILVKSDKVVADSAMMFAFSPLLFLNLCELFCRFP